VGTTVSKEMNCFLLHSITDGKAESTYVLKIETLFSSETLVPTHKTTQYHK
jgi:hypothetical protein